MDKKRIRDIAELAGIAAIIGSLIFVGLQMRQAQRMAAAENVLTFDTNRSAVLDAIAENAELWTKGNPGSESTGSERVVYVTLVERWTSVNFFNYLQANILQGRRPQDSIPVAELAYFLYQNPGAYVVWEEIEGEPSAARDSLLSHLDLEAANEFQAVVRESIQRLRDMKGE